MKNVSFLSENFQFLEVKFSIYLNTRFRNGILTNKQRGPDKYQDKASLLICAPNPKKEINYC